MQLTRNSILYLFFLIFVTAVWPDRSAVSEKLYREGLKKYILQDIDGAISNFEHVYSTDKTHLRAKKMLVNALIKKGTREYQDGALEKAEQHYIRALSLASDHSEVANLLQLVRKKLNSNVKPTQNKKNRRRRKKTAKPVVEKNKDIVILDINEFIAEEEVANSTPVRKAFDINGRLATQSSIAVSLWPWLLLVGIGGGILFLYLRRKKEQKKSKKPGNTQVLPEELRNFELNSRDTNKTSLQHPVKITSETTWNDVGGELYKMPKDVKLAVLKLAKQEIARVSATNLGPLKSVVSPLLVDKDFEIRSQSNEIISKVGSVTPGNRESSRIEVDTGAFLIADIIDSKLGRKSYIREVADIAYKIATGLKGLKPEEVKRAALLADLGYLQTISPLKNELSDKMKTDLVKKGRDLYSAIKENPIVSQAIYHQYEKYNGKGVPDGLSGNKIPLVSRIIAVAKTFVELSKQSEPTVEGHKQLWKRMFALADESLDRNLIAALQSALGESN